MAEVPVVHPDEALARLATLEQELEVIRRELDHGQRLMTVGTMAAGVAHEVNNLLTPALAYAQLADARPDDPALQRKAVGKAVHGIAGAAKILEAILDFSAMSAPVIAEPIAKTLADALALMGRDFGGDGMALRTDIEPDVAAAIDPLALQQIFMNLLLNAIKALRTSGGNVIVTARRQDRDVVITVADDGPGIPAELRGREFEPFVGAGGQSGSASEGRRGHGLGLAMCRHAVESVGGAINCVSGPQGGATFQIRLPAFNPDHVPAR